MSHFTSGEIADMCRVSPMTVNKWFDSGRLKGHRLPDSGDRRIMEESLLKFIANQGLKLRCLEELTNLVFLTSGEAANICCVELHTISEWFDAGLLKGFILPDSGDRRITEESLVKFLVKQGMLLDDLKELTKLVFLTSGEAAQECGVCSHTINRWFKSGRLKGYRLPRSKRRIGNCKIWKESLMELIEELSDA